MNKYHYGALKGLIFGCTFVIFSGQMYDHGNVTGSWIMAVIGLAHFIAFLRNELKAKRGE